MDEYPTKKELKAIRNWKSPIVFHDFMAYIKSMWKYADCGYWTREGDIYKISTGGWSGNEEIIAAMQHNHLFWLMHWYQSQRGGHYIFKDRQYKGNGVFDNEQCNDEPNDIQ